MNSVKMNLLSKMCICDKKYDNFHVPNEWKTNANFNSLLKHPYSIVDLIEHSLEKLGYADNSNMQSDYLHFMILDLLNSEGIKFVEKKEIKQSTALTALFGDVIPNFIIKSDKDKYRYKPLILFVCIDSSREYKDKINSKIYGSETASRNIRSEFDNEVLGMYDLDRAFRNLFSKDKISYLYDQLKIFSRRLDLWNSILELKKERKNKLIRFNDPSKDFERKKFLFAKLRIFK
jgi:hypothetical protein